MYSCLGFILKSSKEKAETAKPALNDSLVTQKVPKIWKPANVRPFPKETNISALDHLRQLSITGILLENFLID